MNLEKLPIEMYEKIFSYVSQNTDFLSCRLVSRRWNSIATMFWKHLPTARAQVYNEDSMSEFLNVMESRIQEFPFCRIRFNNAIHFRNIEAAHNLLVEVSQFIEDVHIFQINGHNSYTSEVCQLFIENFDISVMPNLVKLRIDSALFFLLTSPRPICLEKLHTLEMSLPTEPIETLTTFLVKSAPNLKLFKTCIEFRRSTTDSTPVWQFGEEYKRIAIIELKVRIENYNTYSTRLIAFVMTLNEWKNIQVKELTIEKGVFDVDPDIIQSLIKGHVDSIQHVELQMKFFPVNFRLMPNLETLNLKFMGRGDSEFIETLNGNLFPCLRTVVINSYSEPYENDIFRTAVFETVKTLTLISPSIYYDADISYPESWTDWNTVFPNLESFTFVITSSWIYETHYFQYIFPRLRMKFLMNVKVQAPNTFTELELLSYTNTLSGFTDFAEVMRCAVEARDQGGETAEDAYWTKVEASRLSCWNNLPALTSLYLDLHLNEDFVSGILARMKPLHHLSIYSRKLPEETIRKLTNRHGSVELLNQNPESSWRTEYST